MKTNNYFTPEEKKQLDKLAKLPKRSPYPKDVLQEFIKKYNRSLTAIYQYIERKRNSLAEQSVEETTPVVKRGRPKKENSIPSTINSAVLAKNQFIIPISNWEISTQNGQTRLILKFK